MPAASKISLTVRRVSVRRSVSGHPFILSPLLAETNYIIRRIRKLLKPLENRLNSNVRFCPRRNNTNPPSC